GPNRPCHEVGRGHVTDGRTSFLPVPRREKKPNLNAPNCSSGNFHPSRFPHVNPIAWYRSVRTGSGKTVVAGRFLLPFFRVANSIPFSTELPCSASSVEGMLMRWRTLPLELLLLAFLAVFLLYPLAYIIPGAASDEDYLVRVTSQGQTFSYA